MKRTDVDAPEPSKLEAEQPIDPRGSNQGGLRQYNERVVLQAVRLNGGLSAAEISRLTRLTAQTVSSINKRLLDDGLLLRGEPQRGKVGQPSVPLRLNPDGAFSIGVKVGRRSLDVLLVDFVGQVRQRYSLDYRFPEPKHVVEEIDRRLKEVRRKLPPVLRDRLHGIGIALPLSIEGWMPLLGLPAEVAQRWGGVDLSAEVAALTELPVELLKDTAAGAVAELVLGRGRSVHSFLYVFVDTFIGGGLVLNSQLHTGLHGNAGAIGSLPMGLSKSARSQPPDQLLSVASLLNLERAYEASGLEVGVALDERALQPPWLPLTLAWMERAAAAIAQAVNGAACLLDLEGIIIDGSFSREFLVALLEHVDAALPRDSWDGVTRPQLLAGTIGSDARALGGALLPLYANFAPDRDLFLKPER